MASDVKISSSVLKASKKASQHDYDQSKYIVVDLAIRRDSKSGKFIKKETKK